MDKGKINVVLPSIVNKEDDLNTKVKNVNKIVLARACETKYNFIDQSNNNFQILNMSKIHLKRYDTIQLVRNFRDGMIT